MRRYEVVKFCANFIIFINFQLVGHLTRRCPIRVMDKPDSKQVFAAFLLYIGKRSDPLEEFDYNVIGVTPFFKMMLPYFAVSPVISTA